MERIQDCKERYGNLLEENGQIISRSLQGIRKNNLHAFYFVSTVEIGFFVSGMIF